MIARVLAALDGTPIARRVVEVAAEIADRFDAELLLLRVIQVPPEFPAPAAHGAPPDELPASMRHHAEDELRALSAGLPRAARAALLIEEGEPWHAISDAADRLAVDLVVMGSHIYRWPDAILGTVAGRMANHAHRNVLIVHR
ncbi:MAG: universal stress protein [Byssovorax sp.]